MLATIAIILALAAGVYWHVAVLGFLALAWFTITHLGLVTFVVTHPWVALVRGAAYLAIGAVFSVAKWYLAEKRRYAESVERYNHSRDIPARRGEEPMTLATWLERTKTEPTDYRAEIMGWIGFWPVVMVWTLIDDPLRRMVRAIYNELLGVYKRITDHIWNRPV